TAPIPGYIKTRLAHTDASRGMPSLFTLHNLAYQGRYKARFLEVTGFGWDLFTPDCLEFYDDINLMKAGIAFATKINTVSPRYAQEILTPEFGDGLDGFLRTRKNSLHGILNGVDYTQWNPSADGLIAAPYSVDDLSGKAVCKRALQVGLGLPQRPVPIFAMVSRLFWQKGIDLVVAALDRMLEHDIQVAILGTGDPHYIDPLRQIAAAHPGRMALLLDFDVALSHQIEAGADFFLMPSHYEPCGLSQLYSLRYGTVPIVRETGGLADSVVPITPMDLKNGKATGIVFKLHTPEAFLEAFVQALELYTQPGVLNAVRRTGMKQDFSWERSSRAYVKLYREAIERP
ncbi:MAG: glycogen synthase, partial [Candidatus Hydrogenedentes bacterium]|nr:glycogen synthase [Candidatus Hydrogenedentota bacterium]